MEKELTYAEFKEAKINNNKSRYEDRIHEILRNIELKKGDIDSKGLLTDKFFKREDISEMKKEVLSKINREYKIELGKI